MMIQESAEENCIVEDGESLETEEILDEKSDIEDDDLSVTLSDNQEDIPFILLRLEKNQSGIQKSLRNQRKEISKLVDSISDEKPLLGNILWHLLFPAVLGGIASALISGFGLGFPTHMKIAQTQKEVGWGYKIGHYSSLVFVSSLLSAAFTVSVLGVPDNTERKTKAWSTAIVASLLPSITLSALLSSNQLDELGDSLADSQRDESIFKQATNEIFQNNDSLSREIARISPNLNLQELIDSTVILLDNSSEIQAVSNNLVLIYEKLEDDPTRASEPEIKRVLDELLKEYSNQRFSEEEELKLQQELQKIKDLIGLAD